MTPRAQAEAHPTPDEMRLSEAHDAWVAWDVPECVMKTPYQVLKTAFTHGYLAATRPAVDARSARLAAEQLVQKWQRVDGWGQEELIDAIAAALAATEARYREALEPFAKAFRLYNPNHSDGVAPYMEDGLTIGDLRRAAAILAQTTAEK